MGLYNSNKSFSASQDFVRFAMKKLRESFGERGFKFNVKSESLERTVVEVQRGNIIHQALGLRNGLEITFTKTDETVDVEACACLLENQIAGPALIFYLIPQARIPIAISESAGLILQLGLDEEAIDVVEEAFEEFSGIAPEYCTQCGQRIYGEHKCGASFAFA